MVLDHNACHTALRARDGRFDGLFFTGVKTTGIYCRPVCPARTPKPENCTFFDTAAGAAAAGFRPCLRCRPELSPHAGPVSGRNELAQQALRRIQYDGLFDDSLESLAVELGVSPRHLRRIVVAEYGVTPIRLLQTHRLLFARKLLLETSLPVTEVAFNSGFNSLARFNALFRAEHGLSPRQLRQKSATSRKPRPLRLRLYYRAPFDWDAILGYLAQRCQPGVESVEQGRYCRTVRWGDRAGWILAVASPDRGALEVEVSEGLSDCLLPLTGRLRRLFDLDANPTAIGTALGGDPELKPLLERAPGLRVPGAFEGFELAVRAIVGQQVTVKGANTLAGRLVERFAEPLAEPEHGLTHWPLAPSTLAAATTGEIAAIGIPLKRAGTLREVARLVVDGEIDLNRCADPREAARRLTEIPGIGEWTAEYIVMRALRWPDAFPAEDLGLRRLLDSSRTLSKRELAQRAEVWRPWRSYAAMALWTSSTIRDMEVS